MCSGCASGSPCRHRSIDNDQRAVRGSIPSRNCNELLRRIGMEFGLHDFCGDAYSTIGYIALCSGDRRKLSSINMGASAFALRLQPCGRQVQGGLKTLYALRPIHTQHLQQDLVALDDRQSTFGQLGQAGLEHVQGN